MCCFSVFPVLYLCALVRSEGVNTTITSLKRCYCGCRLEFDQNSVVSALGIVLFFAHISQVLISIIERISIDVVTYHSGRCLGDKPVHRQVDSLVAFDDGRFCVPAAFVLDSPPGELL